MVKESNVFSDDDYQQLIDGILNQLIPASADGKIPAAGALGIARYLARVAETDAESGKILELGFKRADELLTPKGSKFSDLNNHQQVEFVKKLEQQEPEFFSVLLRATYMGYYSRADVRPLFGLSSQPTQPAGYEVPIESPGEMASLTRAVKKRGQCYRPC